MRIGKVRLRDIRRHPNQSIRAEDYITPVGAVTAVISYDKALIREVQEHARLGGREIDEATAVKLTEDAITRTLEEQFGEAEGAGYHYHLELHYEDMLNRDG